MKIANKYEKREKETKSESITIRVTPNQFNTIKTNSTKLGVSMSSYITTLIKDDKIIMFVSKGFIMDNFIVKESYHDFKIEPDSSKVMIYASDIESITVSDPELE